MSQKSVAAWPSTVAKSPRNHAARSIRCTPWSINSPPPARAGSARHSRIRRPGAAGRERRDGAGAPGVDVAGVEERRIRSERGDPLAADQPAADESEFKLRRGAGTVHCEVSNDQGQATRPGDASEV